MAGERTRYPHYVTIRQNMTRWLNNWSGLVDTFYEAVDSERIIDRYGLTFVPPLTSYDTDVVDIEQGRYSTNSVRLRNSVLRGLVIEFGSHPVRVTIRRENPLLINPRLIARLSLNQICLAEGRFGGVRYAGAGKPWLSVFTEYKVKCRPDATQTRLIGTLYHKNTKRLVSEWDIDPPLTSDNYYEYLAAVDLNTIDLIWSPEKRRFVTW